jgi:hypothetical protein
VQMHLSPGSNIEFLMELDNWVRRSLEVYSEADGDLDAGVVAYRRTGSWNMPLQ